MPRNRVLYQKTLIPLIWYYAQAVGAFVTALETQNSAENYTILFIIIEKTVKIA